MPVEDPRAIAKEYLSKHNVEKIFEVRPSLRVARPCALVPQRGSALLRPLSCTCDAESRGLCLQNMQAHILIQRPQNVREFMIEYLTTMKNVRGRHCPVWPAGDGS